MYGITHPFRLGGTLYGDVSPSGPRRDPLWSDVRLLLHFDEADGTSLITDTSAHQTMVPTLGAHVSRTAPLIGLGSGLGSWQTLATSLGFGLSDFTIEGRANLVPNGSSGAQFLWSNRNILPPNGGLFIVVQPDRSVAVGVLQGVNLFSPAGVITAGVDFDWALVRSGTHLRLFIDHVKQDEVVGSPVDVTTDAPWFIGTSSLEDGTRDWNGKMDEVRVTMAARVTDDGPYVPSYPFPDVGPA